MREDTGEVGKKIELMKQEARMYSDKDTVPEGMRRPKFRRLTDDDPTPTVLHRKLN